MSIDNDLHVIDQHSTPNPLVQRLAILAGTWDVAIMMAADEPVIRGKTTARWLPGEYFLEVRSTVAHNAFPKGHMLIGGDDTFGTYMVIYFDSRGIARVYQMSLEGNVWKMWRDAPDFPQRFTGTFREDGRVIDAMWEAATNGIDWAVDFHMTYTKTG